ncbi:MAG: T9SS type A sorting domain-containing protein [Chitinophagales bacterium]
MKVLHKIIIVTSVLLLSISLISFRSDSDDLYWYVNGEPYYWEEQSDVYAFRMHNSSTAKLNIDEELVDRVQHRSDKKDKIRLVYFNEQSSEFDRQQVISEIESSIDFDISFPVITQFPNLKYDKGMWFVVDDHLMANFKPSEIDSSSVQNFEIKHNLLAINRPSGNLPSSASFTYIFEIDDTELKYANAIQLSRSIYLEDQQILKNIQPNLINAYEERGEEEVISSISDNAFSEEREFYLVNVTSEQVRVFCKLPKIDQGIIFNIYDLTGRKLFTKTLNSGAIDFDINLSAYSRGLYIANLENKNGETIEQRKFRKL